MATVCCYLYLYGQEAEGVMLAICLRFTCYVRNQFPSYSACFLVANVFRVADVLGVIREHSCKD